MDGYDWVLPLAAAVADLLIGAGVLLRRRHDRSARVFAAMSASIAGWNLSLAALQGFRDPTLAELVSRLARTGICLGPVTAFHFCLVVAGYTWWGWAFLLRSGYALGFGLAVLNLSGLLVSGVSPHRWGWYPDPTPFYSILTVFVVAYPTLCVVLMWRRRRHPESARQRAQIGCWFLACLVQLPFIGTNLLGLYGFDSYPLGSLGNVFFLSITAYAIVRHRFLDLDWIVRKAVGFTLAASVVVVPGAIAVAMLAGVLGAGQVLPIALAAASLALTAAVLVPALQHGIETRVQRMFFAERWDSRRRLRDLARTVVLGLDERQVLSRLGHDLSEILDLEACAVFGRDEQTRRFELVHPADGTLALDDRVAVALEPYRTPVLVEEIAARAPDVAERLRAQGWAVALPLRAGDQLAALVLLGENRDLRLVSAEDLGLLETVASSAGVAISNARLSRELRRSEAVLQRATRLSSLGMLAAGIAHEIRNPLVAVKTFLDLLPQRAGDAEFVRTFRELSLSEIRRVTDLINDLLTLGKSSRASRELVELGPTLEPVIRLMDSSARKRHVTLVADLAPRLPAVWADPDQLKQIAINLILNALDASPAGSTVRVEAAVAPSGDVVLAVRDEGAGIPAEQLESIFEPFFTTKESGTGLGLALVHQMVVEHGGEITVESTVGRGSRFRVRFPAATATLRRTGT